MDNLLSNLRKKFITPIEAGNSIPARIAQQPINQAKFVGQALNEGSKPFRLIGKTAATGLVKIPTQVATNGRVDLAKNPYIGKAFMTDKEINAVSASPTSPLKFLGKNVLAMGQTAATVAGLPAMATKQGLANVGATSLLSAGAAKLSGQDPRKALAEGAAIAPTISGITRYTNPLIERGVSKFAPQLAIKAPNFVKEGFVRGLANVPEGAVLDAALNRRPLSPGSMAIDLATGFIPGAPNLRKPASTLDGVNPRAYKMHPDDVQDLDVALTTYKSKGFTKEDKAYQLKTIQNILEYYAPGWKKANNSNAIKAAENLMDIATGKTIRQSDFPGMNLVEGGEFKAPYKPGDIKKLEAYREELLGSKKGMSVNNISRYDELKYAADTGNQEAQDILRIVDDLDQQILRAKGAKVKIKGDPQINTKLGEPVPVSQLPQTRSKMPPGSRTNVRQGEVAKLDGNPEPLPFGNDIPSVGKILTTSQTFNRRPKAVKPIDLPTDQASKEFAEGTVKMGNGRGFKSLDPDTQREYQSWVNGQKASPLEGFLKKKEFADLDEKGIQGIFEFQAGNKRGRFADVKKYFDDKFKSNNAQGIEINYKEDYLPQLWSNTQEEVEAVFGKGLGLRPSFTLESIIKDYQTGINAGLKPKFQNISDLVGWYEAKSNKALADRKFFEYLVKGALIQPSDSAPRSWVTLDPDRFPKFTSKTDDGKIVSTYKAPPELAKIINNYLKPSQFATLESIANYVSRVKNIALNFGIPGTGINAHGINILARHTLMGTGSNPISRFLTGGKYMIFPNTAQKYLDTELQRAPAAIREGGLNMSAEDYLGFGKQAENIAGQFSKKWENAFGTPLFNKMLPALKLSSYEELVKNGMSKPEAGKLVNNVYGGINWEQMGRSRDFQNLIRATVLAPDWAETTLRLGGNFGKALNPLHKSEVANRYRAMMATIFASYVAHNVVNKITSGHYSYENDPGHTFEIELGYTDSGEKRYFRPYGTALDMIRLPYDIAKGATEGDFSTIFRTLRNRASIPLGVAIGAATDTDYRGNTIGYRGTDKFGNPMDPGKRAVNIGTEALSFIGLPSFVKQAGSTLTGQQGIEEGVVQGFELPFRYSNTGNSNIQKQVDFISDEMSGKEKYDFNQSLKGQNKFSENQLAMITNGGRGARQMVDQIIAGRKSQSEEDKIKDQLRETGGTEGVDGKFFYYKDGEVKSVNYGSILGMPESNKYEKALKDSKKYSILDDIVESNISQTEKDSLYKKLGIKKQDAEYYTVANQNNNLKTMYVLDQVQNVTDRDQLLKTLVGMRKNVNDKLVLADGVIDNLIDEGLISESEGKSLKNIDYDFSGKLKTRTGRGGGRGRKPSLPKLTAVELNFPKAKRITYKTVKPRKVKEYRLKKVKLGSKKVTRLT